MGEKQNNLVDSIGSSAFWIIFVLLAAGGLAYLLIWSSSPVNDSLRGVVLGVIFSIFIILGLIFSKFKIFQAGTWGSNSLSFMLGFLPWLYFGGKAKAVSTFSLFTVSQNYLYSTIVGKIPQSINFIMTTVVIPVAEEVFWLFGITFAVISVLRILGKKYKLFNNFWLQVFIVSLISGVTFAIFHVGRVNLLFLISAILFRAILAVIILGDVYQDIIPYLAIGWAFGLGAHIGNNLGVFGLSTGILILNDNFFVFGWIVYLLFGLIFLSALNEIIILIRRAFD